ncbi:MAG: hypothetical protein LBQ75_02790, partial [Zoogloeaceae bacterium]|nr:hypothetical protein [Zoogloeaceae bacterium]
MNRLFSLFCFLMVAVCGSAHASPQRAYAFGVDLHNACGYPIQVKAIHHFDRESLDDAKMDQRIEPGETTWVLSVEHISSNIRRAIPDNYHLEIIANSSIISLDKTKFLEVLKKAKYRK